MKKDFQWRLEKGCDWFWGPTVVENDKMSPSIAALLNISDRTDVFVPVSAPG